MTPVPWFAFGTRAAVWAAAIVLAGTAGCATHAAAPPVAGPPSSSSSPPAPAAETRRAAPPPTEDECRACRGVWGKHGIAETPSCNCRTNDGGKACRDGAECEGQCIADADNPRHEVTDPGPPPRGYFLGRCSELASVFGCFRTIDRGAAARGPVPAADPPGMICAD